MLTKATALVGAGKFTEAEKLLRKVISSEKKLTNRLMAMVMLANILKLKGDYKNLSQLYEQIVTYVPSYKLYLYAGESYIFSSAYKQAIKMYEKAVSVSKNKSEKVTAYLYAVTAAMLADNIVKAKTLYKLAEKVDKRMAKSKLTMLIKKLITNNENIPPVHKQKIATLLNDL